MKSKGLLLAVLALFEGARRHELLGGAAGLYERDLLMYYYPSIEVALKTLAEGSWPTRDPSTGFGQPLLGDPGAQLAYPPTWLHLVMRPHHAYAWIVSLHTVWGAFGTALLAGRFSPASGLAGWVAAVLWMSAGTVESLSSLWHHMCGAAWIPWVLYGLERALGGKTALVLAASVGMQTLAGSPDMCAMALGAGILRCVCERRLPLRAAGAWIMGLGIAAIQVLPALVAMGAGSRPALAYHERTYWSLHPLNLIEAVLPVPLGKLGLSDGLNTTLYEGRGPFLASLFLGFAVVPLAIAALADSGVGRSVRVWLAALALGTLAIALGKHAIFYWLVAEVISPLKIFRYPVKVFVLLTLALCVAAGVGATGVARSRQSRLVAVTGLVLIGVCSWSLSFESVQQPLAIYLTGSSTARAAIELAGDLDRTGPLFGAGALLTALVCLRSPGRPAFIAWALIGVLQIASSAMILEGVSPSVDSEFFRYRPDALSFLGGARLPRAYVVDYTVPTARHRASDGPFRGLGGAPPGVAVFLARRASLHPLSAAGFGLEYAWDFDAKRLMDSRLSTLTLAFHAREGSPAITPFLRRAGVSWVVSRHEIASPGLVLERRIPTYLPEDLLLYSVRDSAPLAQLMSGRRPPSGDLIRDFLAEDRAVVEAAPREPPPDFAGVVRVQERRADRLSFVTESNAPALLVVREGHLPGWSARVDGRAVSVERAQAVFVGVDVPPGRHEIVLEYRPWWALAGLGVSLLSLFGVGAAAIRPRAVSLSLIGMLRAPSANVGPWGA